MAGTKTGHGRGLKSSPDRAQPSWLQGGGRRSNHGQWYWPPNPFAGSQCRLILKWRMRISLVACVTLHVSLDHVFEISSSSVSVREKKRGDPKFCASLDGSAVNWVVKLSLWLFTSPVVRLLDSET